MPRRPSPPPVLIWTSATRHEEGSEVRHPVYGRYKVRAVEAKDLEWKHELEKV